MIGCCMTHIILKDSWILHPTILKGTCVHLSQYRDNDGSLLYLSHGTGDDNVHMQNTIQLIDALQKQGKHFELMLYPGGMHGYRGYQNDHSDNEEMRFWRKTLLGL